MKHLLALIGFLGVAAVAGSLALAAIRIVLTRPAKIRTEPPAESDPTVVGDGAWIEGRVK